jgi:inosine/xanthosine triphosphatase
MGAELSAPGGALEIRRVAVGSTNPVKVAAVRWAVAAAWPRAEVVGLAVASGVPEMPCTDEQGRRGALIRAQAALAAGAADLALGLEGAVCELADGMYVANWVAAVARDGRTSVTHGGRLRLPECVAAEVRRGIELGLVIDRLSGSANSKQHLGAAGFLTAGLVPREQAFALAVAFALTPFLRPELYAAAGA